MFPPSSPEKITFSFTLVGLRQDFTEGVQATTSGSGPLCPLGVWGNPSPGKYLKLRFSEMGFLHSEAKSACILL